MRFGKLTSIELQSNVLDLLKARRNEVIVGPAAGEDCAVIRAVDGLVFLTCDPITAAASDLGTLAVHINCNDLAASGAEPLGIMINLLMPPSAGPEDVKAVMADAEEAAKNLRIDVLGGHTEFTNAVGRPIISATGVGMARKAINTSTAAIGDAIVMTKSAGLEGAYIIAKDHADRLVSLPMLDEMAGDHAAAEILVSDKKITADKNTPVKKKTAKNATDDRSAVEITEADIAETLNFIKSISVLPVSRICLKYEVSAMHDATEGGVLNAVAELCRGCGLGAEIQESKIPVAEVTRKICARLNLNPYKLLSSGSLLCAVKKPKPMLEELQAAGIEAAVIGYIEPKERGMVCIGKKGVETAITEETDEINKLTSIN